MTRMAISIRSTPFPAIFLAVVLAAPGSFAQQSAPVSPIHQPGATAETGDFGDGSRDPEQSRMFREMSRDRNALRQKEIIDDTNQMMDLVKQLKDAVARSNKNQLSLSVVNTATEIEKLAKTVKEKMRDGQ